MSFKSPWLLGNGIKSVSKRLLAMPPVQWGWRVVHAPGRLERRLRYFLHQSLSTSDFYLFCGTLTLPLSMNSHQKIMLVEIFSLCKMLIDGQQWENCLAVLISVHLKLHRTLKDPSNHDLIWQLGLATIIFCVNSGTWFSAASCVLYLIGP